jgi:hypothetical protein
MIMDIIDTGPGMDIAVILHTYSVAETAATIHLHCVFQDYLQIYIEGTYSNAYLSQERPIHLPYKYGRILGKILKGEKSRERYRNPEVSVTEIAEANGQ